MTGTREGWRPLGSARDAVSRYLGLGLRRRGREEEEEEEEAVAVAGPSPTLLEPKVASALVALMGAPLLPPRIGPGPPPPTEAVPHCRQRDTWDCGVACVQMVLGWLRRDGRDGGDRWGSPPSPPSRADLVARQDLLGLLGTRSIWTVDLLYLLLGEGPDADADADADAGAAGAPPARYLMCSSRLGVDSSYRAYGYYEKAFASDEARVTRRFAAASEKGWPMAETAGPGRLDAATVAGVVARAGCVAIVLVDQSILEPPEPPEPASGQEGDGTTAADGGSWNSKKKYAGHYVVICGISTDAAEIAEASGAASDAPSYCFAVKNPAKDRATDFVAPALLERAWRADGTDDDIIFCCRE